MFPNLHISPVPNGFLLVAHTDQLSAVSDTLTKAQLSYKLDRGFRLGRNSGLRPTQTSESWARPSK